MTLLQSTWRLTAALGLAISPCYFADAVEKGRWELSPYRVRIYLATTPEVSAEELAAYLRKRIFATLHPLWKSDVEISRGSLRHLLLDDLAQLNELLDPVGTEFDKALYLTVVGELDGYRVSCREWDCTVQVWGPMLQRRVQQRLMLGEQCFQLLGDTFAPLAKVTIDADDESRVNLVFKGSALPRRHEETVLVRSGDLYQPHLMRFNHVGEVLPDGISVVPWTYLTLGKGDPRQWEATVHTGIRRPFGVRRRGRSEHLAIAKRDPPTPVRVRFHARHDPTQGLSGYEVFLRMPNSEESVPLGLTDTTGSVVVDESWPSVPTLYLRCDGQVLAKVPVPAGTGPLVEVPIADDAARLRAQAELMAAREQLIDVVARRNILMARIRARAAEGKFDEARELLQELEDLPGRAQFDQIITAAERNPHNRSSDARIQQRIEKLFSDTRLLLGRFLDLRPITELRNEVSKAARGGDQPTKPSPSLNTEDH